MYTSRSQPALNAKMSLIIIPLHHNTLAYYPGIPTEIARKDWRNWAYPPRYDLSGRRIGRNEYLSSPQPGDL